MYFPLPWIILLPYNRIRFLSGSRNLTERDKQIRKWLRKPNNPMRPQDHRVERVEEINNMIKIGKTVFVQYVDSEKELTSLRVVPERLFRRGMHI
jgi:hypothetical protein